MREREERLGDVLRSTGKNGRKWNSSASNSNQKKYRFFRLPVIALAFFIGGVYGIYALTSNADLWLKIPEGEDINVIRLLINNEIIFDEGKNVRESRFFGVNPSNGKNQLKVYFVKNESGLIEERSCVFNRSAHSCLMEVFISEKNFSCSDCDHLK